MSSSQLYHYFEDKPALVRAVIERQADRAIGTQEQLDLSTFDGLREWRDFVVDHARDTDGRDGCPVGSLGSALADTEPEARRSLPRRSTLGGPHHGRASPEACAWPTRTRGRSAPARAGLTRRASRRPLLAQVQREPEPLAGALDAMVTLIATLSTTTSTSLNS